MDAADQPESTGVDRRSVTNRTAWIQHVLAPTALEMVTFPALVHAAGSKIVSWNVDQDVGKGDDEAATYRSRSFVPLHSERSPYFCTAGHALRHEPLKSRGDFITTLST